MVTVLHIDRNLFLKPSLTVANSFGNQHESVKMTSHANWSDMLSDNPGSVSEESESEMFLFDPYQKYIQSNNETILDQGTPIKTSLVANIRAAYYIINNYFLISQAKNT